MDVNFWRYLAGSGAAVTLGAFYPLWYLEAPMYSAKVQMIVNFVCGCAGLYSMYELARFIYYEHILVCREEEERKAAERKTVRLGA